MKKVFFDTNFLLRFYLDDIPPQALKAKRMVLAAKEGGILLVTDLIVICEMVWVLDSFYNLAKKLISEKITNLYRTPGVLVLNGDLLPDALSIYVTKNIDFTDAVVASSATKNHIEYLASFDKKHMKRLSNLGIKRIESPDEIL
ncbi:MAG: PIN domain-containing protein [Deltaproteobacteria bacterium]|jgi:predicted nucleic-acid-binding protein|nr:PIN domain-containing protein [Deltaproteobacteria bacterium]